MIFAVEAHPAVKSQAWKQPVRTFTKLTIMAMLGKFKGSLDLPTPAIAFPSY